MYIFKHLFPLIICAASSLGGCSSFGLFVPEMKEFYQAMDERLDENVIVSQIKCELHKGVQDTLAEYGPGGDYYSPSTSNYNAEWLRTWAAKVTLKLVVDEKSELSPGVSYFKQMPSLHFLAAERSRIRVHSLWVEDCRHRPTRRERKLSGLHTHLQTC
jgi:hypothetical protein